MPDSDGTQAAIAFVSKEVDATGDADAYIRAIYLLHHILVEEDYDEQAHDKMAVLLKKYFEESYRKFGTDNAEYLFFAGKIAYIAEWYFGLDDDTKPIEQRQAFRMQKRAWELEPGNLLYEWACVFHLPINQEHSSWQNKYWPTNPT